MSNAESPANLHSPFSETAEVRLVPLWPWPRSEFKLAYLLVSSRIYWKVAKKHGKNKPQSFLDFRNASSLELVRLDSGTWDNVDEYVNVSNHNGELLITVRGRLHRRSGGNSAYLVQNASVQIIARTSEQQQVLVNKIRARIAPWKLLQQEFKNVSSRTLSYTTEEPEENWSDDVILLEYIRKLTIVDELTAQTTEAMETGAQLTKLEVSVQRVAEVAKLVDGRSNLVAGVSTMLHLIMLCAQVVWMCAEAKHGQRVLPVALGRIVFLLRFVLEGLMRLMNPSRGLNEIDEELVFDVLKQVVRTVDRTETQFLRMNSEDLEKTVRQIEDLRPLAVTSALSQRVNELEQEREILGDEPHHGRPSVSSFFSGRTRELATLREILEKWGSAVVTQYGGSGKTEFMVAFADQAERDKLVTGGVFWLTADGGERDMITSLAGLAEKLTHKKMREEERCNPHSVVEVLKEGLDEREGRWLLCLDNADDRELSGILNEVCAIARRRRGNGWVLVTSRQGQPHIWSRMKGEQRLVLEPLSTEDAMVVLWRHFRKIETGDAGDDAVMNQINELQETNADEYQALKDLCGDETAGSLGGLPLALVQAGTYMAGSECSFSKYRSMLENAKRIEDMHDIMGKTEDMRLIRESQRSIWTTWRISVGQLSAKAYNVLRAMAMLDVSGVGEGIVKGIMKGVIAGEESSVGRMFQKVVIEELVGGSSLISRDWGAEKEGQNGWMYIMHRLVRRFILSDMERGSALWNEVYNIALVTVHEAVGTQLKKEGTSFAQLPDVFGNSHCETIAHALALVDHYTLPRPGSVIVHGSKIEDIHRYGGLALELTGRAEQEIQVWKDLLEILHHKQVANRNRNHIRRLSNIRRRRNTEEEKLRIADVYNSLGLAFMTNGDFDAAVNKHNQSLEIRRAINGPNKPDSGIATTLNNLGSAYEGMGKLNKALEMYKKSLEMRREIYGPNKPHADIATSLNNLGSVNEGIGRLNKALEKYEASLEMKLAIHGRSKPHPTIATSLNNLGNIYLQMGKLKEALEKHEQSLAMRLKIHGSNRPHPDIAISLSNIGSVYQRLGKLDKALEKHEETLVMLRAIHGHRKNHADIAKTLNNLGTVYQRLYKLYKASEMHEKSLEMRLAIHGRNKPHPDVAASLSNLGTVYQRLGKLKEALEKHEQSLTIQLKIHGPNMPHPDVATSLNNLGLVYEALGRLDVALEKHEQSLKMYRAIHGPNTPHAAIAISLCNVGSVYQELGEIDKALENYEDSLKIYRAIQGHNKPHSDIARLLNNIADVYYSQGNLLQATEFFERSVDMLRTVHGAGSAHPEIAATLSNLGSVYQAQGKEGKALKTLEQSLEIYRAIHGQDTAHHDIARLLRSIGLVCRGLRLLDRSAESYEQCLEILRIIHGSNSVHPQISAVLLNLVDVYEEQGKRDEAAELRKQITGTRKASGGESSKRGGRK